MNTPQPEVSNSIATQENHTTIDPLKDSISSLELIRVSGSDIDIVNAARVSYGKLSSSITERDKKLIHYLAQHKHTSPFEHNQLSFRVKLPIFVARQWQRHRMNSYNEVSYRYVQAPVEFYTPLSWRYQDATNRQCSRGTFQDTTLSDAYAQSIQKSFETYELLLAQGVSREIARGVLPLCTYTEFIFTCNLHSLVHFLHLRLHPGAQQEIQAYARGMYQLAFPYFPVSLEAWKNVFNFTLSEQ
ncbi:MAG: FAD-dependent thymidylate synthase [Candidatus Babeliales bacterium]